MNTNRNLLNQIYFVIIKNDSAHTKHKLLNTEQHLFNKILVSWNHSACPIVMGTTSMPVSGFNDLAD